MKEKFDNFSVNNRILLIMKEKNLNKNSLSKVIGFSQPGLTKIEKHINLPSFKLLFELLRVFPDIDAKWLLTGEGEMLKTGEPAQQSLTNYLEKKNAEKEKMITLLNKEIASLNNENGTLRAELKNAKQQHGYDFNANFPALSMVAEPMPDYRKKGVDVKQQTKK
jgi:transcriptional regulator with XRE-family HTH domain